MMGYYFGAWSWPWMVVSMLLMVAFWGGLILLAIWGVRRLFPRATDTTLVLQTDDDALETLRRRYAAGEINADEFEQRRASLERMRQTALPL